MLLDVISRASSSVDTFYVYERGCENGNIRFPSLRGEEGGGVKKSGKRGRRSSQLQVDLWNFVFFLNTAVYNSVVLHLYCSISEDEVVKYLYLT